MSHDLQTPSEMVPATVHSMGSPTPPGWQQPEPWPVTRYHGLRLAVLYLYAQKCQRCGADDGRCAMVNSALKRTPENLLVFCSPCIGKKSEWTESEIARYRKIARDNAEMIVRMTGWGLARKVPTPKQPQKPVREPGRPAASDPAELLTRIVVFRINEQQELAITKGDPSFDLNAYARDRLLARRNVHLYTKKRLHEVATALNSSNRTFSNVLTAYTKAAPDHPIVRALGTELERLRAAHGSLLDIILSL